MEKNQVLMAEILVQKVDVEMQQEEEAPAGSGSSVMKAAVEVLIF